MTHTLVPSDRIEGAPVCGRHGEKIGTIERLMLDKISGQVAYAVLRCANGLNAPHHYPVAWQALRYNPALRTYEIGATVEDLRTGPSELDGEDFDWGERKPSYRHAQYWTV